MRFCVITLLSLGFVSGLAPLAVAQQGGAQDVVYQAARNRVGLLKYCWENGLVDVGDAYRAIQLSGKDLARLGAKLSPATLRSGDTAEKEGEAGILGPNGKRSIDSFARAFRTTPASLCKEWASEQLRGAEAKRNYITRPDLVKEVAAELSPPPPPERGVAAAPKRWAPPPMSAYGCRPEDWWLGER